jgi:SSS family solute:Na+ symporter
MLGGVWIIQSLPAVIIGLYTRWFHEKARFLGWLVGIVAGTALAAAQNFTPIYPLVIAGHALPSYTAFATLVLNFAVAIVLTPVFNALGGARGTDETSVEHYG